MTLHVDNLSITFPTRSGLVYAVRGISFTVHKGETVAIVGESGCGKSVTAHAIAGLNPPCRTGGSIVFNDRDLLGLDEKAMRSVRGRDIALVFQNPMTSLNPTMRVGKQISEGIRRHRGFSRKQAMSAAQEMLQTVGIDPDRLNHYPHQFSGGQRQRVMIAIALACHPQLLIADEPTTALDIDTQEQILSLIKTLQQGLGMSLIFITHNLKLVQGLCDRVVVMYAGRAVEVGSVEQIFSKPRHPYTQALLKAIPEKGRPLQSIGGQPPDTRVKPQGCLFCPRCPHAMPVCGQQEPPDSCWLQGEKQ